MKTYQIVIALLCLPLISSKYDSESNESNESYASEESYEDEDLYASVESNESNESKELTDLPSCRDHNFKQGVCTELEHCEKLLRNHGTMLRHKERKLIKNTTKHCQTKFPHDICCPINSNYMSYSSLSRDNIPSTETCGSVCIKRTFPKVVGGRNSEIGAWPWLAVLAYDAVTRIQFTCGGALITNQHVITAAHCLRDNLVFARLGEYDLSKDTETKHLDIDIKKTITHSFIPKTGRNDLAILVLEKNVQFTDLISPICLPTSAELRKKSFLGQRPFVAGWGHTKEDGKGSNILQELQTAVLENKVCYEGFKAIDAAETEDNFDESILCVGDVGGGKDTCQGDSGGPLMMPEMIDGAMHYYIIGVVSRGKGCARKGVAGTYTNIPYQMDWILENLK